MASSKDFFRDLGGYLRRGFARPWIAAYALLTTAYDLAAGPLGLPDLKPEHYLLLGAVALVVAPFSAYRQMASERRKFEAAISGDHPIVGPGLELVKQAVGFTHVSEADSWMRRALRAELPRPPDHMAQIQVRVLEQRGCCLKAVCSGPAYSGTGQYRNADDGQAYGAMLHKLGPNTVRYPFAGPSIPIGAVVSLAIGSPAPVWFRRVDFDGDAN